MADPRKMAASWTDHDRRGRADLFYAAGYRGGRQGALPAVEPARDGCDRNAVAGMRPLRCSRERETMRRVIGFFPRASLRPKMDGRYRRRSGAHRDLRECAESAAR